MRREPYVKASKYLVYFLGVSIVRWVLTEEGARLLIRLRRPTKHQDRLFSATSSGGEVYFVSNPEPARSTQ